jgi:hypothetical protein
MLMDMKITTTPKGIISIKLQKKIETLICARIIKLALKIATNLQQSNNKAHIGQH